MTQTRTALVRIVNDNPRSARNAHVYDAATGEDLSGWVSRIEMTIDAAGGAPLAHVTMVFPQFDIVTNAEIETTPIDMQSIESIDFAIEMLKRRLSELVKGAS